MSNDTYEKLLPIKHTVSNTSNISTLNSINLSRISNTSIETTKSELIQRILDSFISNDESIEVTNKIYINFKDENELGMNPNIDDLLEKIDDTKKCLCHRIKIHFNNQYLNQQLSYKQKQSILRIILRRQQLFDRYFS